MLPLVNHPSYDPERFFHNEAPASLQKWIDALVGFIDAQREFRELRPRVGITFTPSLTHQSGEWVVAVVIVAAGGIA